MIWDEVDEYDWIYQECRECGYWWKITRYPRRTVRLRRYRAQPWFNHVEVCCPKCKQPRRLFGMRRGVFRRLSSFLSRTPIERFAPDSVVADFERYFGINPPAQRKLTPRQEQLVAEYRQQLEAE